MSTKHIVLLFISLIYILVLFGFNKARVKFAGGKLAGLVNIVIVTVILLFVADYILLFEQYFDEGIIFIVQTVLRTSALCVLAFGGIRISGD